MASAKDEFLTLAGMSAAPTDWHPAFVAWANLVSRENSPAQLLQPNTILLGGLTGLTGDHEPCYNDAGVWQLAPGTPCGLNYTGSALSAALAWGASIAALAPCAANCCAAGHAAFPTAPVNEACAVALAFPGSDVDAGDPSGFSAWCPESTGFAWTAWVSWLTHGAVTCTFDPCLVTVPDPTGTTLGTAFRCTGGADPAAAPTFQATLNATALAMNVACTCAGAGSAGALCGGNGTCVGSGVALTTSGACSAEDIAAGVPVAAYSDPAAGVGSTPCVCSSAAFTGPDCTEGTDCPAACTAAVGVCAGSVCVCVPGFTGADCATPLCAVAPGDTHPCSNQPCVNGVCACTAGRCGLDCSDPCSDTAGAFTMGGPQPLAYARTTPPASSTSHVANVAAWAVAGSISVVILLLLLRALFHYVAARRASTHAARAAGGHSGPPRTL